MTKIKQRSYGCFLAKKVLNLLAVCVLLTATAFTGTVFAADAEEYLTYTLNDDNTAKITGCNADIITTAQLKNLVIPDTLTVDGKEYTVVEVGGFLSNQSIVTVTLPDTLEALGAGAFNNCDALTTVTMPSCKTIGSKAFYNCKKLSKMNSDYAGEMLLPDNLEIIKASVFRTSNSVKTVVIPESVTELGSFLCFRATGVKNIIFLSDVEKNSDNFKTIVGAHDWFTTVNLFAPAAAPIALYSQTDEAYDNYVGYDTTNSGKTNKPLFKLITEESDVIVYNESFADGNGTPFKGTQEDANNTTNAVKFSARVLNTSDEEKNLTGILSVIGADNTLKGVGLCDINLPANGGKSIAYSDLGVENIDLTAGDIISVRIWEDLADIKPVITRKLDFDILPEEVPIMAIGDSYTADSVLYLDDIAKADKANLKVYSLYLDGQTLAEHHAALGDEAVLYNLQENGVSSDTQYSIKAAAGMCDWDYVMLGGTTNNSDYDDAFWGKDNETGETVDAASVWTALKDEIATAVPDAKRLVHATWAQNEEATKVFNGGEFAAGIPDARGAMTAKILERAQLGADIYSTEAVNDEKNAYIPTAVAVDYLIRHYGFSEYNTDADGNYLNENNTRSVYRDADCHLTDNVGKVLAGLVWYEMITGTPATESKYTRATLSEQDMKWIKEAAHYACENYMTYDPASITLDPDADLSGLTFAADKMYSTFEPLPAMPYTFEATVRMAEGDTSRQGAILSSYKNGSNTAVNLEVYTYGIPRLYLIDDNLKKHDYMFKDVNVCTGDWVHLAITCDAEARKLYCYVNGELADSLNMHETHPMSIDMALPACLGGDSRSGNAQYFKGRIKNVSLYSDTRSASEIKSDFAGTSPDKDNLIASYDLSGYTIYDTPDTVDDVSGNEVYMDYLGDSWIKHVPMPDDYAYSFALIGDTQIINERCHDVFSGLFDWIADNAEKHKIKWAFGLGDITQTSAAAEWERARDNYQKLDGIVPYSVIRGNHDGTAKLNEYFSYDAYLNRTLGYWTTGTKLQNTYFTFEVGDVKYLVLCINYGAGDAILDWAGKIIEKYPDRNVIINTHTYIIKNGELVNENNCTVAPSLNMGAGYNNGDDMWEKLVKKYENISFVFCGHISSMEGVGYSQMTGDNGNTVTAIIHDPSMLDYSAVPDGGGFVAMLYFSEDGRQMTVRHYSTALDSFYRREEQFSLEVDVLDTAAE